jgi:peptide/nickel transport system substrate-binding protein
MTAIPRIFGTAMAVAAAIGLAATPAAAQKVLRVVPHADLKVLDPTTTTATITLMHGVYIYDFLFNWDEKLDAKPQMVGDHNVSADSLTYSFKLRPGLKFHDGSPVTSKDVVASLTRWMKKDSVGGSLQDRMASLEATGSDTFVIKMKEKYGPVLFSLASAGGQLPIIMREKEASVDLGTVITETIGSGPFKFNKGEWVPGSKVIYDKNPDYVPRSEPASSLAGGKVVKLDRVEYKVIPDSATSIAALNAGEVDVVDQPPLDMVKLVRNNPDVRVEALFPVPAVGVIRPNHLHPPFNNVKARMALQMMVDQLDYLRAGFGDDERLWSVCHSYFVCGAPYGTDAGAEPYKKADMQKARQLLAESGYKGEKITIIGASDLPSLHAMTLVTAEKLKAIGGNVEVILADWGSIVTRRSKKESPEQGGWNIFHTTWGGLSMHHPLTNVAVNADCAQKNWFGWPCDQEAMKLRDQFLAAATPDEQKRIAEAYHKRLYEVQPLAVTGQYSQPTFYRKNVTGLLKAAILTFWNVDKS